MRQVRHARNYQFKCFHNFKEIIRVGQFYQIADPMSDSTPLREIYNCQISHQPTSQDKSSLQMRVDYQQKILANYKEKAQLMQSQNIQLTRKMSALVAQLQSRQAKIQQLENANEQLKQIIKESEKRSISALGQVVTQKRASSSHEVLIIKLKQQLQNKEKINRTLSAENNILLTQNTQFKKQICHLEETVEESSIERESERKQLTLLEQLNSDLKLEIEDLLFQLKTLHRREKSSLLLDYEAQIEKRVFGNSQEQGDDSSQTVDLLNQRIKSLQQQLARSEQRCKNLQLIILGPQ